MAWNGDSNAVGVNTYKNYMYGNKIFILDEITSDNCAYLIGDLTNFIFDEQNSGRKLDVIINSPGGDAHTMQAIIGLLNMAKLFDIEIHTFVFGLAGSAASLIAVQGDLRYMTEISTHFVHFGTIRDVTEKHSEIEKIYAQNREYADNMVNLYVKASNGKLKKETVLALQSDERGYLNAESCLKYGLCDYILEDQLMRKQLEEEDRQRFEDRYERFLQQKEHKMNVLEKKSVKHSNKKTSNKKKTKKEK